MTKKSNGTAVRTGRRHPEDSLQAAIVSFTAQAVKPSDMLLFAVPNGGQRNPREAARMTGVSSSQRDLMSDEDAMKPAGLGTLPGANDLMVLLPEGRSILVELKTSDVKHPMAALGGPALLHKAGTLSKAQRRFRAASERLGHDYRVVRSLEEWRSLLIEKGVPVRATLC